MANAPDHIPDEIDNPDRGLLLGMWGYGPERGDIATMHQIDGEITGEFSDDIDDGTPQTRWNQPNLITQLAPGWDSDRHDITMAHAEAELSKLVLIDGEACKCSWSPLAIPVRNDPEGLLTASITIHPLTSIVGSVAYAEDSSEVQFGLEYKPIDSGGGVTGSFGYGVSRPATTHVLSGDLSWEFDIVKRPKGSGDDAWVHHGFPVLDPKPAPLSVKQ